MRKKSDGTPKKIERIYFRCSPELKEKIKLAAKRQGVDMSELLKITFQNLD